MIPEEQAWEIIAGHVKPLPPRQTALPDLNGLVLAEDVRAEEDLPPFPASTMDGYAVIAADQNEQRRVLGEQRGQHEVDRRAKYVAREKDLQTGSRAHLLGRAEWLESSADTRLCRLG